MTQDALLITTVLNAWKTILDRANKTFASFRDEDLQLEVAPGKNRAYYLLGHLTAVHDRMLPLLRVGERLHPELDEAFLVNPDRKTAGGEVSPAALREAWSEVNEKLNSAFEALGPQQWLERHSAVSEEDFAKEPHRNRFAVLISRAGHVAYHEGQLRLIPRAAA